MRASYDRRGRIRGYNGGPGTYYWFQLLGLAFFLLIVVPVAVVLLVLALLCVIGWGACNLIGRREAGEWWRATAAGVMNVLVGFGQWSDRQQQ